MSFKFAHFFVISTTFFYIQSLLRREQFCEIPTLWAYNFGTVRRKKSKISLKNPKFIHGSLEAIFGLTKMTQKTVTGDGCGVMSGVQNNGF
jgi:hypothetical protein